MNANKKAKSVLAALLAGMMVFASACNQGTTNSSEPAGRFFRGGRIWSAGIL